MLKVPLNANEPTFSNFGIETRETGGTSEGSETERCKTVHCLTLLWSLLQPTGSYSLIFWLILRLDSLGGCVMLK